MGQDVEELTRCVTGATTSATSSGVTGSVMSAMSSGVMSSVACTWGTTKTSGMGDLYV